MRHEIPMPRRRARLSIAAAGAALALLFVLGCGDSSNRRRLQTVVDVRDQSVVVRYEDGRQVEVLNDMNWDLTTGQEVKVVENCDGRLHVAAAYAMTP
jgi:hypothetical protein